MIWVLVAAVILYVIHLDARISDLQSQLDVIENDVEGLQVFGETLP